MSMCWNLCVGTVEDRVWRVVERVRMQFEAVGHVHRFLSVGRQSQLGLPINCQQSSSAIYRVRSRLQVYVTVDQVQTLAYVLFNVQKAHLN